ncbi:MAG: hypothetical protein SFV23_13260 [Planctomycetaceae bacterium]|nr:hypothetical protein [Planctomycetaceae bacterium]
MTQRCCWPLRAATGLTFWGLVVVTALAQPPAQSPPRSTKLPTQTAPGSAPRPQAGTRPLIAAQPASAPASGQTRPAPQAGNAQPAGQPRPAGEALRVETLDPKLEQILKDWERESAKIKVLQGEHKRSEFNKVFGVEKQSKGMFYFEAPDKGRIDMQGIEVKPGAKSSMVDPVTMEPYELACGADQGWICTGNEVLVLTPSEKQFEAFPIPPNMQGANIIQSPLPFLFGMKADDAKRRFQLTLRGQNEKAYVIGAVPRLQMDAQNYSHAMISLDKVTFIPRGVQLIDPAGTLMTKYTFENIQVNPARNSVLSALGGWFGRDTDPFHPELRGWKKILPPAIEPASNQVPGKGNNAPPAARTARAFAPQ